MLNKWHINNITVGGNTYTFNYDICGNQTQENTERFFQWDYADRMRLYYNQASVGTEPSVITHYLYDAGGNRVKKLTRTQGGGWECITYIDGLIEYRENHNGQQQSISHIMDDSKRIASIRKGHDFEDTTPEIKYNMDDHLGSSNLSVDENGTLVNREEYYPFGETSFGSYNKKRYRFCCKEKDEESGLYYYGARYYSPWTCRFISVDPLAGDYPFYTPYQYAGNQPINFIDLDGLEQGLPQTPAGSGSVPTPPVSNVPQQGSTTTGTPPQTTTSTPEVHSRFAIAASLADNVYGGPNVAKPLGGFVKANEKMAELMKEGVIFEDPDTGLKSALYERTNSNGTKEYAYVFAGTEPGDLKDWKEDENQALGKDSPQYQQASENARLIDDNLFGSKLTFVGHSLGGGLASAAAYATGRSAITFNSAGLHQNTLKSNKLDKSAKIDAFIVEGEIVDYLQAKRGLTAAGTQYILPAICDTLMQRAINHTMSVVIQKMTEQGIK